MSSRDGFDTRFSLPAVDDPPATEVGVILMGLDAERLLAGLGLATLADDPAVVTLVIDRVRHDGVARMPLDALVEAGARRWRSVRAALAAASQGIPVSGSLRQVWTQTLRALSVCEVGELGPATASYLAACWLRREDIDKRAAGLLSPGKGTSHVVSEVATG